MRISLIILAVLTLTQACASQTPRKISSSEWVGNVEVKRNRRGENNNYKFDGNAIDKNISDYDVTEIDFEYFKAGATEPGHSTWQMIDAKAQAVSDSTGKVFNEGALPIVSHAGNNAVYKIDLNALEPDHVAGLDPEIRGGHTMHAHINVMMNGQQVLSIPVNFSNKP